VFAAELGVRKNIVPQRKAASTWCAFGAAAADVLHIFEHTEIMQTPIDAARVNKIIAALEQKAGNLMTEEGIAASRQRFEFSLDVRHRGQINEVEVALAEERLSSGSEARVRRDFVTRYEKLYGRGSALHGAQLEVVVCRLRARALTPRPKLLKAKSLSTRIPRDAVRKPRTIQWASARKTPVYDGEKLAIGNVVKGPAIVETSDTTVVVHPKSRLRVDALGNFELTFA
jgi:N-methylhydantoinase A